MSSPLNDKLARAASEAAPSGLNVARVREDFPLLSHSVRERPLVYLDNAATTQKPQSVIETLDAYYRQYNANVHRGIHELSQRATEAYEGAREKVRAHINAASSREIIFTRGTTDAINLVAHSFGRARIGSGDEVLITELEHHSNIVPWQLLCEESGAELKVLPVNAKGELETGRLEALITSRTKLFAVGHVSNALGTINPIAELIERAHQHEVPVLVDGAQALPHMGLDVQALDADFYAFSGHKVFGPTGIGVLYGKEALLEAMPPYQGGGEMIEHVSFSGTRFKALPYKFEAGTPHIAGAIGLGAALDYLSAIGPAAIFAHEAELTAYAHRRLSEVPGIRFIGEAEHKAAVVSFVLEDIHANDIGTLLDHQGVAIRVGHHCAMPAMERFGVTATVRASLAFYNTQEEIDALVAALFKARQLFD